MQVYPKSVHGPVRRFKWAVLIVCLGIYYLLPWLRWHRGVNQPDQAVLLSIWHERFYFFNLEFWPQDIYYLTGLLIMGAVTLFLVTSLLGRVWCGYTCPQTVWTDLFMWIERLIEGDRNERMKRDAEPLTLRHRLAQGVEARRLARHRVLDRRRVDHVLRRCADGDGGILDRHRVEARCISSPSCSPPRPICWPAGRASRSAPTCARGRASSRRCWTSRASPSPIRAGAANRVCAAGDTRPTPAGDCIDCGACVTACPTGIDIRDGIQLECINCGLCIDACNHVMERTGRPKWLITWDTLADQAAKAEGRQTTLHLLRPRTLIYVSALLVAVVVMTVALLMRSSIGLSVLHDRAPLFVRLPDGDLRNGYTVKIVNKGPNIALFELRTEGLNAASLAEADEGLGPASRLGLLVKGDSVGTFRITVAGEPEHLVDGSQGIDFILRNTETGEQTVYHSLFMGPR